MTFVTTPALLAALAFRGGVPVWLAVSLAAVAAAAAVRVYLRETAQVPVWRRLLLAGFRGLALASILFLALRPTIVTDVHGERPRPVAVLVDDTQSMTARDARPDLADRWRVGIAFDRIAPNTPVPALASSAEVPDGPDRPTRLEVAQAALTNPRLGLLDGLAKVGPVQPAAFGGRRTALDPKDGRWVAGLAGRETRTALADALFDLLRSDPAGLPAAVVVVTDGRDNGSDRTLDEAAREAARVGVPLHVYGVGGSAVGHVQVRDVPVAETLFVDDTAAVPVRYRVRGVKDGQVEITARLRGANGRDGREVARKVVPAAEGDDLKEVLTFVPTKADAADGKQDLVVGVRVVGGGDAAADEITRSVRVVDRKVKVLVVDSLARWDYKFLQRALLRDRRVEARFLLTDGDPKALRSGPPYVPAFPATQQELLGFDLLILGDVPATALSPEQQGFVREFVAEGGGVIAVAGRYHGPATWVGTPLADVLPVELPGRGAGAGPAGAVGYRPEPTPAGARSPLLSLDDDPAENLLTWRALPELWWAHPVEKLKPAAEVLLAHPDRRSADGKPLPLLAAHYYGKGYAVFVGFDESWRWRFNAADKYFGRFWGQAVYAAGVPRTLGTKLAQLSLDAADPVLGRAGQVYARLFTADYKPVAADRIEARLDRVDAGPDDPDRSAPVELKALPGQPGEFVATVPFDRVGRFVLRVEAGTEPATLEYRVGLPPDHELAPGGMAEDDLRRLAEGSGGRFYREEDLHALAAAVKPGAVPFTQREELLLWNKWLLAWVIGLFCGEWFLRKFNSLS